MTKLLIDRELLPCPFCGSSDVEIDGKPAILDALDSVICNQCTAGAPIHAWQARQNPTPADGVEVVAWLDDGEDCPNATASRRVMMDWVNCGYSFKPLITLAAHQAEVARLRGELIEVHKQLDRFRSQSHGIAALAKHERLRTQLDRANALLATLYEWIDRTSLHGTDAIGLMLRIDAHLAQQAKP